MANNAQCSKPFTPTSRARAEEAERDGTTLILLEKILRCECGARVGARRSATGRLIPTRHFSYKAASPVPLARKTRRSRVADHPYTLRLSDSAHTSRLAFSCRAIELDNS